MPTRGLRTRIKGVWKVYVAFEPECTEPRLWSKAFIIEMAYPFRVGKGRRLRLGSRAVQVGWCHKNLDSDALEQIGGRNLGGEPTDIGGWGRDPAAEESAED